MAFSILAWFGRGPKTFTADLTTPEGAILTLEEAYRERDIEKAVACKDFGVEAAYMLRDKPELRSDEILAKLAETLELAYRKEMSGGFPDMKGVTSTFPAKKNLGNGKVVVTEVCKYPDGGTSKQNLVVANTTAGWKVIVPIR